MDYYMKALEKEEGYDLKESKGYFLALTNKCLKSHARLPRIYSMNTFLQLPQLPKCLSPTLVYYLILILILNLRLSLNQQCFSAMCHPCFGKILLLQHLH